MPHLIMAKEDRRTDLVSPAMAAAAAIAGHDNCFANEVCALVRRAQEPVRGFVFDAGAIHREKQLEVLYGWRLI